MTGPGDYQRALDNAERPGLGAQAGRCPAPWGGVGLPDGS